MSIVGTQFSDMDWILTNLYLQHKMNAGRLNDVFGQIDNTDFLDLYGLINPQTAFMNLNFSVGVTVLVFTGITSFALKDYRIDYDLGLASQEVELLLSDKGIHKQESYSNTAGD